MSDIPSFESLGWSRIRGRGWAAAVECDQERDRGNPGLTGRTVSIDGEYFECVGVLRDMPAFPIRKGEKIGLLVKERAPAA